MIEFVRQGRQRRAENLVQMRRRFLETPQYREILDMLLSFSRDMLHLAAGSADIVNRPVRQFLEGFGSRLNLQRSLQLADNILETRRSVQRNANAKLALDLLFMKIAGTTTA